MSERSRLLTSIWRLKRTALATAALSAMLIAAVLIACSPNDAQRRFSDYATRLSRPVDLEVVPISGIKPPVPPRSGELQIPIQASSIDGMDFLRLRGCALQQTIARRNSSLGKLAPPSQRLILELEFLQLVPDCIAKMREDQNLELAELLAQSAAQKQNQLPAVIFNATLGSAEYRRFWRNHKPNPTYPANTSSVPITALNYFANNAERWLSGNYAVDGLELELALADVAEGDGGQLLAALQMQHQTLDSLSIALEELATEKPLCEKGLKPASAEITRNVVTRYFIGQIQPWSARINQRHHELLPRIEGLEVLLADELPDSYEVWRQERRQFISRTTRAPADHVRALQSLLGSCFSEFRPAAAG